jgi:lactate dehydrogenase-like 2-hydroxyacid dehydrogenase
MSAREAQAQLVLLRDFPPGLMRALEAEYVLHRLWEAPDPDAVIRRIAPHVRGIVTGSLVGASASLMDALPHAGIVACFGVGVDTIDLAHAKRRGVTVTNTPDVLNEDVADLGVALLLAASRRIPQADRFVRQGRWPTELMPFTHRVHGARAGIVGLGRIGQAVARRLEAFDMAICYHGPRDKHHPRYTYYEDLIAMARECEFLVLCCPGGEATRNLVDRSVLSALGPEGTLVNIARGSVVDEPALVAALQTGSIRAAALDVYANEPHVPQALFALDNVVLQPHLSSSTHETRAAMADLVMANLRAHFEGRPVPTPV